MESESYFIWKGLNSLDKHIMTNKLPGFERAEANITKIVIPGRDGFLTVDDGTYQGKIRPCECSLDDGNIDDVCAWLTGSSEAIFSNEPDKKYKATIINKIPFAKIIPIFHTFIIQFECQPHKYSLDCSLISLTSPGTIFNLGTANSLPKIKVYGSGAIVLNINSKMINLSNVSEYVVIDSDLIDCYKDTVLKNNDMSGEFPVLIPGLNGISWSGSVTKVEILPNFRYL